MADDPETTVWQRVSRRRSVSSDEYSGPDRRGGDASSLLQWLPLALACLAGVAGYVRMEATGEHTARAVEKLEARVDKLEDDNDETHAALWTRVGDLMSSMP